MTSDAEALTLASPREQPAYRASRSTRPPFVPSAIVVLFVLAAVAPQLLATADPLTTDLSRALAPPAWEAGGSLERPLGTDPLGRDVYSRTVHGARVSLAVAFSALAVAGILGLAVGLVSGYVGGAVDAVLMRLADAALSIPIFLIALMLAVVVGPSEINVIIVIGGITWAQYARVIRGEVLSLREREFAIAAKVVGAGTRRILSRHILPNVLPTFVVIATAQIGFVILIEASLSFLGAGIPRPAPAWGTLVAAGRDILTQAWWVSFFPGLAIASVVLSLNFLGDWIRDRLDPKHVTPAA